MPLHCESVKIPGVDLNHFLTTRRPRWDRLSTLLDRVDKRGLGSLSYDEVSEFFALYRLVSSDLNLAQTRTGNPALLEYLEGLVGRAYASLAVPRRTNILAAWWRILRHDFPAAIRAERHAMGLSLLALLLGVILGFALTYARPSAAEVFLPPEQLAQSPSARVAELEAMEATGGGRIKSADQNLAFGTFLFTHNIRVTVLGFALGLTFGVGTAVVLFYNGAMVGSLAALYFSDGVLKFFLAWVGPHGAVELPCVVMGCGAGLMLARTQYRWNHGSVASQLREIRPRLVHLLVGVSSLLVIAGMIEGGFSQINEPTIPYSLKITVAVAVFALLLAYLFWIPVRPGDEGRTE